MFHQSMKHLTSAARRIYNTLLGVSSGDETPRLKLDILQ